MRLLGKIFIVCFLGACCFSCVNSEDSAESRKKSRQPTRIDINQLTTIAAEGNLATFQKILLEGVSGALQNPQQVDTFLSSQPELLKNTISDQNEKQLLDFFSGLDFNDLEKSLLMAARFVLSSDIQKDNPSLRDIAHFHLADAQRWSQNRDSLAYYLNQLDFDNSPILKEFFQSGYYNLLGTQAHFEGNYVQSIAHFKTALEYSEKEGPANLSLLYQNLADQYSKLKYYEKADSLMQLAVNFLPDSSVKLSMWNTWATIKMRLNELDTSRLLFEDVLMDSSIQFYPNIRAMVYSNLGNVYRRMKKADAALTYFDKSDSICGYHNIDIGYLINAVNRAEVYFDFDDLTSAKKELSKAINLIETYPIPEYEAEIFRLFTRYYDVVGMPNEANAYFRKHTIILNQMKGDETKSILMEWELNNERKAHIIKTIQKELEAQNQKNQKNLALIGSAFVLMGTLFFFKSKSRKQQLTQEKILREKEKLEFNLEIRSKELLLETMKSFTVHNVKSSVEVSLTELVSNLPKMHQQRFQTLLADLRSKKEISLLKEFDQRFTSIHENFYKTLSKRGPDLTPAELRICALMRLNMTTKDISNLTQRTPGTIDNLRCSVRKKLHLQEHDNLQSYLLNL